MLSRRSFIKSSAVAGVAMLNSNSLLASFGGQDVLSKLTILHTNDVHSHLDPFPMDGSKNQGLGGVAARAELIRSIRMENEHVLLLDAGDIFQGTAYFNIFNGEPDIKAMSEMQYDASTIGNHDFDAGMDNLSKQMNHASFPFLISNYDFTDTALENRTHPYKIFTKGKLKIGVTGVGIELRGLVADNLFGNAKYIDPISKVNEVAYKLKREHKCDYIICLSHLGYKYEYNKVSDVILAKESEYIDCIIGGHTHTFLTTPVVIKNKIGSDVIINQVGWGGLLLGRIDVEFSKIKNKNFYKSNTVLVGKKTI